MHRTSGSEECRLPPEQRQSKPPLCKPGKMVELRWGTYYIGKIHLTMYLIIYFNSLNEKKYQLSRKKKRVNFLTEKDAKFREDEIMKFTHPW